MLKKLFAKRKKAITEKITAPVNGELIRISEVPDPVFAQKMMGDGVAIIPEDGNFVSPAKGEIIKVFPTKHAVGLRTVNGLELLIHIGLETVELNGKGFQTFVVPGQKVEPGELLVKADLQYLEEKNKEIVTPVIITNMEEKVASLETVECGEIKSGDTIINCSIR